MLPVMRNILLSSGIVKRGLVGLYKFNEAADSQILYDYSGYNNHGKNGTTTGADTNDATPGAQGWTFGGDDYALIANSASLALAPYFTAGVVFKFTHHTAIQIILAKYLWVTTHKGFAMRVLTDDKLNLVTGDGSTSATHTYGTALTPSKYYFAEASRGSTETVLRLNGVEVLKWANETFVDAAQSVSFGAIFTGELPSLNSEINYGYYNNRQISLNEHLQNYRYIKREMAKRGVALG